MTLFDLIIRHLDTSAQFWQHHHLDILILNIDGLPLFVNLLVRDRFNHRIRIHYTARTLIHTLLQKDRVLLWLSHLISRNSYDFSPSFYHFSLFTVYCLQFTDDYSAISIFQFFTSSFSKSSKLLPLVSGQLLNKNTKAQIQMAL